jgi:hypothetical protein
MDLRKSINIYKPLPTSPVGEENKQLAFLAAKVQCSNLKVPNWWFGCIWLHFSVLIVAIN